MTSGDKRIYFNELATCWDSLPKAAGAREGVSSFCRRGCPSSARDVLDAGSGTGLLAPYLLRENHVTRLVELDFAFEMLRESARKQEDRRIVRVCGDVLFLPFPSASFDAILCFGILPHLSDLKSALAELWRVLRPTGVIAVGHLLGSSQLNELHESIGGAVAGDRLPAATELALLFRELGAVAVNAKDTPDCYFVRAEKGAP